MVDIETVFDTAADIVVTQRQAIADPETADQLDAYVRRIGGALIFDLDDDQLTSTTGNSVRREAVRRMLAVADAVWVATNGLAERLASIRPDAIIMEDKLDERIWLPPPPLAPYWDDPVRILYLRTESPDADLAMIEPALMRLKSDYGDRINSDVLAGVRPRDLPRGLNGINPSANASRSYPGFVDWMTRSRPVWHIGLAPLVDTPLNRCRSPVKALDYAALGLAVLASDVPTYRGSLADGPAGQLVPNNPEAWHAALDWLIRDQDFRRALAAKARRSFDESGSLASAARQRVTALRSLLPASRLQVDPVALTIPHDQSHPAARTKRRSGRGR